MLHDEVSVPSLKNMEVSSISWTKSDCSSRGPGENSSGGSGSETNEVDDGTDVNGGGVARASDSTPCDVREVGAPEEEVTDKDVFGTCLSKFLSESVAKIKYNTHANLQMH